MSFLTDVLGGSSRNWVVSGPRGAVELTLNEAPGWPDGPVLILHSLTALEEFDADYEWCGASGAGHCWHVPVSDEDTARLVQGFRATNREDWLLAQLGEFYVDRLATVEAGAS